MSPELRTASCHCGNLTVTCDGDPVKVSQCHCHDCQRRTGSLFSVAAFFRRDRFHTDATSSTYARPSASGFPVTFHFCPRCGASVWWEAARMPHLVAVAMGAFADPHFPLPEQAVWVSEAHDWLAVPDGIPTHPQNPPPRAPETSPGD